MHLPTWWTRLAIVVALLSPACAETRPVPPPLVPQQTLLLCDASIDSALVAALAAPGRTIQRSPMTKDNQAPECASAALVADSVGDACQRDAQGCQTPAYINGKPVAIEASPYDAVILPDDVVRRTTNHQVTEYESRQGSVAGPPGSTGARGGGQRGGGQRGGGPPQKVVRTVSDSDEG